MRGKGFVFMLLRLLILAAAAFGPAGWSYAMDINCNVQNTDVVWELRVIPDLELVNYSYMGKDAGNDWTCDPGLENIRQTGEDKGSTTGEFKDENGDSKLDLLTVKVINIYPCYYNEVSMKVYNGGSEPITMPQPVLHWLGQEILLEDGMVTTVYDPEGKAVMELCWLNNTGKVLYPGKKFEEVFEFHFIAPPATPPEITGLTPGYWKNWRNHYTAEQFNALLKSTIAPDIATADKIFSHYSAAPGKEITILKAHLLAAQLTLNLTKMPELPNPDGACLTESSKVEWQGGVITVGEAVKRALDILANPAAYTREQILQVKDLLDMINNLKIPTKG